jgi:hypothetical protein
MCVGCHARCKRKKAAGTPPELSFNLRQPTSAMSHRYPAVHHFVTTHFLMDAAGIFHQPTRRSKNQLMSIRFDMPLPSRTQPFATHAYPYAAGMFADNI